MKRVAWMGVGLAAVYWVAESFMDHYVYGEGPLLQRLIAPDLNELEMRFIVMMALTSFGFYAQSAIRRIERVENRLARMNECFLKFGPDPLVNIDRLTSLCGELLGASAAVYNRLDGNRLHPWGHWGAATSCEARECPVGWMCYDTILSGGEDTQVLRNLPQTSYAQTDPNVRAHGFQTYVGRAVRLGETTVGSLCTVFQRDYTPTEDDKRLIGIISSAISVEEVRRQAEMALRESEARLRRLSSQLITAQEAERKRIARQLHDSVGQSLSAIKFSIEESLERLRRHVDEEKLRPLQAAVPHIRGIVDEIRRIQRNLRPSMLDDLGILATIHWFCKDFQAIYDTIRVEAQLDVEEGDIPKPLKVVIYRILQEAMNNVAKHSRAESVRLILRKTQAALELAVEDDGLGFDVEEALSGQSQRGMGLSGMRERTELSGGSFAIESHNGEGTKVRIRWLWKHIRINGQSDLS